ncbi:hypothetical protein SAMN05216262_11648 [Colwellia chukchiensis]|uniref:Uncharacterized protein n=1 Tax=Colwellia chukchiensis TaxID=641665 RepID=A0A1H7RXV8_9GAMM|nr:hypothetical protein [Colwellia chukchiensis]SEL64946.1 hypothetical protein SAMN05216262_11648 [Colwellia chukchiensis]
MTMLKKCLMLGALLVAAFIAYGYGFSHGLLLFIVFGMVLELTFWFAIFTQKNANSPNR